MPSFSQIVKDHQDLRNTITLIEDMKRKIKKNEKEMHPPEEFALRTNSIKL